MQNLDGIYMVLGKIVHEIRVCPRAVLVPLATLWSPAHMIQRHIYTNRETRDLHGERNQ